MSKSELREDLTAEQADVLEKAAFLIISARQEAAAMLEKAGVKPRSDFGWWGNPCMAMADVGHRCGCRNYTGDGGPCLTRTTTDPPATPPYRSCGHKASEHVPT